MSSTWKRDFASGLIVLFPLLVTAFILTWMYNRIKQVPLDIQPAPLRVGLTIVVFILLVFAVGYLMRTALGTLVEAGIDDIMNRLPGLRVVYNASKMAVETAVGGTDELQAPVKLETWSGTRMTAFKTGQRAADGRDLLFLPTAPNITTGFVIEVEPDRYDEIDESVEDALTRILSAGFGEASDTEVSLGMLTGDDVEETDRSGGDGEATTDGDDDQT